MAQQSGSGTTQINRDLSVRRGALPTLTGPGFEPGDGVTVARPSGSGVGWWAGAPSALWSDGRYHLSYRLRRPRPERGGSIHVAVSDDGVRFETVWTADKRAFDSPSLERSALVRRSDSQWRLYVSYVDGADGRWRIDLLEAASPDAFDPRRRQEVLTAHDIGAEGVKDPLVLSLGDEWLMAASYVPTPAQGAADPAELHRTMDVYATGLATSATGLATSPDGLHWRWHGGVLAPSETGWDAYTSRLTTVIATTGGWLGYYDGCRDARQNYEERCGLVTSEDLRHWSRAGSGPAVGASGGPGTVRYVEAVQTPGWIRFYYEYTRPDGSHELRTCLRQIV